MSLDYVEIDLDRTRRLRYRIRDLRDLCQAMGNVTMLELLARLAGLDPNAVVTCLRYGLIHEEPKLTIQKAEDLIEAHKDKHGDISGVLSAINDAIERSGIVRRRDGNSSGEAPGGRPE